MCLSQQKQKEIVNPDRNFCLTLCHPLLALLQRCTWMGPLDLEPHLVHPPTGHRQDETSNHILIKSNKILFGTFF